MVDGVQMKYIFNKYIVALYILVLIVLMLFPWRGFNVNNPIPGDEVGDYIAHFIVFLPWSLCGYMLYGEDLKMGRWIIIGSLFIIALELSQYLVPYRGANIYDVIVGEVGLLCSCFSYLIYRKYREK